MDCCHLSNLWQAAICWFTAPSFQFTFENQFGNSRIMCGDIYRLLPLTKCVSYGPNDSQCMRIFHFQSCHTSREEWSINLHELRVRFRLDRDSSFESQNNSRDVNRTRHSIGIRTYFKLILRLPAVRDSGSFSPGYFHPKSKSLALGLLSKKGSNWSYLSSQRNAE